MQLKHFLCFLGVRAWNKKLNDDDDDVDDEDISEGHGFASVTSR